MTPDVRHDHSLLGEQDLHLFNEGTHTRLWTVMGSHPGEVDGAQGAHFSVWAPAAREISVIGDFNGWEPDAHRLAPRGSSGIHEGFVEGVSKGERYKYRITGPDGRTFEKADPYAVRHEVPPATASMVWDLAYEWEDEAWMASRDGLNGFDAPISVYELHLGSWRRVPEEDDRPLTYREIAPRLAEYVTASGFTHVELLPVMEHPFYGSWGYQTTGYFAPTSRYGSPQDFMFLVDTLHRAGVGVILDWVPSHFPMDPHALYEFDGTHLYEHADPREGVHPDWDSAIFNYGRHEVRAFLLSSARYWFDEYHIDGLRVDAVASMLYRDYSREEGEWIPNEHGGRENLEAMGFLRRMNEAIYEAHPDVQTVAEESTAWPMVSRPTYLGGLGFGMKWDMGWMHDTLLYLAREAVHRRWHHHDLTFRMVYAFTENFMLPLSHDEVVHGKGSLLAKMPGDGWQKMANLRLLLGYMWAMPGKKLLFMGGEFGQWSEWNHEESLAWHLLDEKAHAGLRHWVGDLNRVYRELPALHVFDFDARGFEWVTADDAEHSVLAFLRKGADADDDVLCVFNFTPVPRENYRVGITRAGVWEEVVNSDAEPYGGSGWGSLGTIESTPAPCHGRPHSLVLTLPALGAVYLRRVADGSPD